MLLRSANGTQTLTFSESLREQKLIPSLEKSTQFLNYCVLRMNTMTAVYLSIDFSFKTKFSFF